MVTSRQVFFDQFAPTSTADTNAIAIGLIGNGADRDALVRAVDRANRWGHDVLVSMRNCEPPDDDFLDGLEASVVNEANSSEPIPRRLETVAKRGGYSGLITHWLHDGYIKYDRSVAKLKRTDAFRVGAVVSSSSVGQRILAAIPAYNEEGSIASVVRTTRQYVDNVLVVDDGSDDDTAARARKAGATVLVHSQNRGYGSALRSIFREGRQRGVDQLVILDGDGQHDPADIPRLLDGLRRSEASLVIGNRFGDDSETEVPRYRAIGLWMINFLTNFCMGNVRKDDRIEDTQSGFRAYDATAIATLATDETIGTGMGASTDVLCQANHHDLRIEEIDVTIAYDVECSNTRNPIAHGIELVSNIGYRFGQERPILSVALLGFWLVIVSVSYILTSSSRRPNSDSSLSLWVQSADRPRQSTSSEERSTDRPLENISLMQKLPLSKTS